MSSAIQDQRHQHRPKAIGNATCEAMGLRLFFNRRAIPAKRLNGPQPVIDSNSLRETALRASWHRDHRVARRREAWRWVMFWSWKYGRTPAAIVVTLAMAAWLAFLLNPGMFRSLTAAAPDQSTPLAKIPLVGPTIAQPLNAPAGVRLLPTTTLHTGIDTPSPDGHMAAPSSWSPPLRLTPEIQTSPKESSP